MNSMEQNQPEGTVKKPEASVEMIRFSGGNKFTFKPKEKIILVGPNNSGKSQTLREIFGITANGNQNRQVVVKEVTIKKEGTSDDLKRFLDAKLDAKAELQDGYYSHNHWKMHMTHIQFWDQQYLTNGLAPGFIKNISADRRLQICKPPNRVDPHEQKSAPQHILFEDSSLMNSVSNLFKQAFRKDLMFDFRSKTLRIHVGVKPNDGLVDRAGDDYTNAVRDNPLLHEQGDGMKSYAGILFETVVSNLDINLLDEPEAFLHPPQMRHIGKTLASEVGGQLFVATHSSDIMRGFLEGIKGDVRLLRIHREGSKNFVKEAKSEIVQELWKDPVLRYSKALEGIFHEETIVCEAESDCRLLNAMADHLAENQHWKDTAYVPAGGKHHIRKIANVLRQVGVPVKAVFDIDFLAEENLVNETVKLFGVGGEWENIEPLWKQVDAAIKNNVKPKEPNEIKSELVSEINNCDSNDLPSKSDLTNILKQDSPWNMVKRYGKDGIPKGNAQTIYEELKEKLENIGIYVIDKGEIENFYREIGKHGTGFVTELLISVQLDNPKLEDLRNFVKSVHQGSHAPLPE